VPSRCARVMEGGFAPKADLLVLAGADAGWLADLMLRKTRAADWIMRRTGRSQDRPFKRVRLSLCAMGCDQAFKGIWWMPWH
jgi:hypothetical protein